MKLDLWIEHLTAQGYILKFKGGGVRLKKRGQIPTYRYWTALSGYVLNAVVGAYMFYADNTVDETDIRTAVNWDTLFTIEYRGGWYFITLHDTGASYQGGRLSDAIARVKR